MKKQIHRLACIFAVLLVVLMCSSCQSRADQAGETELSNGDKLQDVTNKVNELSQKDESTIPDSNNTDKPNDSNSQTPSKPNPPTPPKPPQPPKPSNPQPEASQPPESPESKPPVPPAKFAMTPDEIIAYGRSICNGMGLIWCESGDKNNSGWNVPWEIYRTDSEVSIKQAIEGCIKSTYKNGPGNGYKILVENLGDQYKIYFLY